MINRIYQLLLTKINSIFCRSMSISSRIEYSAVSKKAKIWGHCKLYFATVDDYSYVGRHCRLIHTHVGKFCSIAGDYSQIGMGIHSISNISSSPIFTAANNATGYKWTNQTIFEEYKEVLIGNDVWVGSRVLIMGGVRIGNGAVIGAGAVVTKDVPPYAVVGGVPAKIIRYRFQQDMIEKLEKTQWWMLPDDVLKANVELFQKPLDNDNMIHLIDLCKKYI